MRPSTPLISPAHPNGPWKARAVTKADPIVASDRSVRSKARSPVLDFLLVPFVAMPGAPIVACSIYIDLIVPLRTSGFSHFLAKQAIHVGNSDNPFRCPARLRDQAFPMPRGMVRC